MTEVKKAESNGRTGKRRPSLAVSAVSNQVPLAVHVIIVFLLTPYLITHLGKARYGIWVLVASFIGYYGLLRLGVGPGVMRYLPFYIGRGNSRAGNEVVNTGLFIFLVAGFVILIISNIAARPVAHFYRAGPEFITVFRLMGIAAAIECPMRILDATVRAHEKWVAANTVTVLADLLRAAGLAGCVYLGYGLSQMALVALGIAVFSLILMSYIFFKFCPEVHLKLSMVRLSHARALVSFGIFSTITALGWSLTLQSHSMIIGRIISLNAVTLYAVAALIMRNVRSAVVAPNRVLWPRFAYLDGGSSSEDIQTLFRRATHYNAIFSSGMILMVFAAGPAFIGLWVKSGFESIYPVLYVLAIAYLIEMSLAAVNPLMAGIGRQKMQSLFAAIEGILGIVFSILLTMRFGLIGCAFGFVLSIALIRGFACPLYICRLLKINLGVYYLEGLARPWLILAAGIAVVHYIRPEDFVLGWISLITWAIGVAFVFTLFAYFFALNATEKTYVQSRMRKLGAKCLIPKGNK